jgi:hypothetical protein
MLASLETRKFILVSGALKFIELKQNNCPCLQLNWRSDE